jgi:hypothetical protein
VPVKAPDGIETFGQISFTLEDVLFPEAEHFIADSGEHNNRRYLTDVSEAQLGKDPTA